ncbi:hypothetical protein JR064_16885 [Xanthomonas sp. CFBP 8703]|uniref:Secreted protein n=1 Tax=Xanthomonas bonasiae TaxID=2810351 RepID=A0ABS3B8V5_9XANT|nr:hypothetical protein [Xanthomonas bonasiae]MBN6103846.1 hypothetical protein [Xanthomonas bonasiae]
MNHAAARPFSLLLLVLPVFARAAPSPSYVMEQWSQPGNCATPQQRHAADRASSDGVSAKILTQRYLGVLDAVIAGDEAALKFAHLCDRFEVDFLPGMLPPPRAEPWNPSPPQTVGSVFVAYVDAPGTAFQQRIEATYTPEEASLSLSISSHADTAASADGEQGYRYRDMDGVCPLRLGQLADRLAAAGFSKQYYSLEPPSQAFAESDYGVSASFRRDKLAVGATLQGLFVEQRAHPEAACVAEISLSLAK